MALLPDLGTEIVIPVCSVIEIVFSLVQWVIVSLVKLSSEYDWEAVAKNGNNGYGDYLIEEEEGTDRERLRSRMPPWAKPLLDNNVKEIADPRLGEAYDVVEMKRAMFVASAFIHHMPDKRPSIKQVVQLLKGDNGVDLKQKSIAGRALLMDACDLEDYTSATYRKELNCHMQLVME